ncbi:MAG: alpha/beta hydrolase [Acidobacteria bacterium]|nr:alpha/beta hydrolase [Acidobacteriota bacterium]
MSTPTYLLVHGAWHGSWCWQRLGTVLDERGATWAVIDLPSANSSDPLIDMGADVRELRRFSVERGPVVLVAHSYGGAVVAEAAPKLSDLRGIVYLAALVPRLGQSASDVTREYGRRSPLDETIRREDGLLRLDPEPAALALYGDCDDETREWAINKVTPQTLASFRTPRTAENIAVASTYVICQRDQAIVPEVQSQIAQRCDDIVEIDSDHSPFLSHPEVLADLLESMNFRA